MQNVLVSGASGHLGYNLIKLLIAKEITPKVLFLNNEVPGYFSNLSDKIDILEINCQNCPELTAAFKDVEVVFHTGTSGQVHDYIHPVNTLDPEEMIGRTENLIRAFAESNGKKMVFASSYALGSGQKGFSPDQFTLPYLRGKIGAEKKAKEMAKDLHANIVFIKASMIIGPDDYILTPANQFLLDLLNNHIRFIPRGGINPVDVRDVAQGLITAAESSNDDKEFILSGDDNLYIREFVYRLSEVRDINIPDSVLSKNKAKRLARISEWFGHLLDHPALFSPEIATNMVERYAWFDNSQTKTKLHWHPRPIKETLLDSIVFLEDHWMDK